MSVITRTGSSETGSFQPIIKTLGNKHKHERTIPLSAGGSFRVDVASIKPTTTHNENAERLASQVSPCQSIGSTSMMPATIPINSPVTILLPIVTTSPCSPCFQLRSSLAPDEARDGALVFLVGYAILFQKPRFLGHWRQ